MISIIVPTYNALNTLQACVDSIKAQDYSDWELILSDDGSTDGCESMIQRLAYEDQRIIALNNSHQGVFSARNAALDKAIGEYICFVDADDTIEPDYLSVLLQGKDFDMTICGYYVDCYNKDHQFISQGIHIPLSIQVHSLKSQRTLLKDLFLSGMIHLNCNKLLKRSIIEAYHIRYESMPINEDYCFMLQYLSQADSLCTINKPVYHWVRIEHIQSSVDSFPNNIIELYTLAHSRTTAFFQDRKIAGEILYFSYYFLILKYFNAIHQEKKNYKDLRKLMNNKYVKEAFQFHQPVSRGEHLLHTLLHLHCFRLFHLIHKHTC